MSDMVERVARAICLTAQPDEDCCPRGESPACSRCASAARAAIAAMREPTDAMTAEGADVIEADDRMDAEALVRNAAAIYKTMIDAAVTGAVVTMDKNTEEFSPAFQAYLKTLKPLFAPVRIDWSGDTDYAAQCSVGGGPADKSAIIVTEEMISAAMPHVMRVDTGTSTDADFVEILTDIYLAMRAAEPDYPATEREVQ